jgi:hypothetical protein
MSVSQLEDGTIVLEGVCPIEDAEPLLRLLSSGPGAVVDWRGCDGAHTAIVQLLMASGARLQGPPRGRFLDRFVGPALRGSQT